MFKRLWMQFGGTVLGLLVFSLPSLGAPEPLARPLEALAAFHAGRWDAAIAHCKKIIAASPPSPAAYQILVAASLRKKDLHGARSYLETLRARRPNDPRLPYALARCAVEEKQYSLARQGFYQAIGLSPDFAEPFVELIETYKAMEDLDSGIKFFTAYVRAHPTRANGYLGLGYGYDLKTETDKALANFNKAVRLDSKNLLAYRKKSLLCYRMGKYDEFLRTGAVITKLARAKDPEALYKNYGNLGMAYKALNNPARAFASYQQAWEWAQRVGDEPYQLQYAYEMGALQIGLDGAGPALAALMEALRLSRKLNQAGYESWTLLRIGEAYDRLGDRDQAEAYYKQALQLHRRMNDYQGVCYGYKNLGDLQDMIGEYDKAIDFYMQALTIAQDAQSPNSDALQEMVLLLLGRAYVRKGNYPLALDYYKQALDRAEKCDDPLRKQLALGHVGSIHLRMGNFDDALSSLARARQLAERAEQQEYVGFWLSRMGEGYLKRGQIRAAEMSYKRAREIGQGLAHPRIIREATKGLGAVMEAQGNEAAAFALYRQTIEMVEAERNRLVLEKEKSGFFEDKIEVYERIINLLIRRKDSDPSRNNLNLAFHYAERAKAQAFLQRLPQGQLLKHLRGISSVYAEWFAGHQKKLDQKYRQLIAKRAEWQDSMLRNVDLLHLAGTGHKTPASSVDTRKAEVAELEIEIDRMEKEQISLLNQIKSKFPAFAKLYEPEILDARRIQSLLKANETLVEYHVQPERTLAFVVGSQRLDVVELPLGRNKRNGLREMIEAMVWSFRPDAPPRNPSETAALLAKMHEFYRQIFQPLEKYFLPESELVVVPDDVLNYLPFAMMVIVQRNHRPQFLIERYPISYAYSASLLNPALWAGRKGNRRLDVDLLAIGNPAFGGNAPSMSNWFTKMRQNVLGLAASPATRSDGLAPLPYAEREVQAISRYFKRPTVLVGRAATEAAFKSKAPQARIIHLATHNALDTENIWQSKIALALDPQVEQAGEDGLLYAYEICDLDLNADLVVLSACESGLGKLRAGEGLMGMSRAFLYAGAPSLMASLWPIADGESTLMLMKKFYSHLAQGMNKRKALQRAQVDLLQNDHYAHPFYWAPFILIGNTAEISIERPSSRWPLILSLSIILLLALMAGVAFKKMMALG